MEKSENSESHAVDARSNLDAVVANRVETEIMALHLRSRFVAGLVCCASAVLLSHTSNFSGLGESSNIWAGIVGFIIGALLGERTVFFLLGSLATYLVLTKHGP